MKLRPDAGGVAGAFLLKRVIVWLFTMFVTCHASPARAHIGSPNVFFDGAAGPYPVHVVIRPPGVIPGLSEISIRVNTNGVGRVSVLPMRWNSGRQGAPRPDIARGVPGETNLYAAQLWFMVAGAQSVEIEVSGTAGTGRVIIPVNAVATTVLNMPRGLGTLLFVLASCLILLAAGIFGGAVRESVLAPGEVPTPRRRWIAGSMTTGALVAFLSVVWFGKAWWNKEASDYRNNRLFRPVTTVAEVLTNREVPYVRIKTGAELLRRNGPFVPDHGKLMHLFLVREPGLDAFAHLHPVKVDWQTFEVPLPALPGGSYRLYGDVTYETGFSDTLTTQISLPAEGQSHKGADPDDSWRVATGVNEAVESPQFTSGRITMSRAEPAPLVVNQDTELRFLVRDGSGREVPLESYMGMRGHLIVRKDDGTVFTHLHPSGSFSMAAKQLFDLRVEGKAPMALASYKSEPICKLPGTYSASAGAVPNEVSFPYAFPKPGRYRLWVQTRISGEVFTGVFDVTVKG